MKSILLLSDTHMYIGKEMIKHAKTVDEVWHAGDIGAIEVIDELAKHTLVRAVHGNIDNHEVRMEHPAEQLFNCEGMKVWMIHIGGYPPNYTKRLAPQLYQKKPDIFICGHSHILKVIYDKKQDILHLNPGAIGKSGFHKVRTMLKFKIENKKIFDMQILEYPIKP